MTRFAEQTMPQAGTAINKMVSSKEAAGMLGLADQTLRKMRIVGNGPPYFKLNASVRYKVGDLMAWIDARRTSSTSQAAA